MNPACKDLGYAEDEACVLYIAVSCQDTVLCSGEVEVDYESHTPRRISPGKTKHSIMYDDYINYYYMTMTPSSLQDLFAVMTPLSGDADLYVSVKPAPAKTDSPQTPPAGYLNNWSLPTPSNNTYESSTKLNAAEMVRMPKDELKKHCGWSKWMDTKDFKNATARQQLLKDHEQDDCLIVFAIKYLHLKK